MHPQKSHAPLQAELAKYNGQKQPQESEKEQQGCSSTKVCPIIVLALTRS